MFAYNKVLVFSTSISCRNAAVFGNVGRVSLLSRCR